MRSHIRFEERTGYAWWVHGVMLFVVLACLTPYLTALGLIPGLHRSPDAGALPRLPLYLGLGIPVLFYGLMGELRTRVTDTEIRLAWGAAELIRKRVPFSEIRAARAVTYSPLTEFGGWGIRWSAKGKTSWTTRGNRALRLEMADGKVLYVGSDRPERILPFVRPGGK
jgi:hypothetical protein